MKTLHTLTLAAALLTVGAGLVTTLQQSGAGSASAQPSAIGSAIGAERTVILAVDYLEGGCPSCAFIVGRALSAVDGVRVLDVSTETGTATVIYDPAKTDVAALTEATAAVGFPSTMAE